MKTDKKKVNDIRPRHIVEYREFLNGPLSIKDIKKFDTDKALNEASILKDKGCHDVIIRIIS